MPPDANDRASLSALLADLARAPAPAPEAVAFAAGLAPGARVGRFEFVRELGRGAFGVVWEARDTALGRSVAFKLVRPGKFEQGEEQIQREAEAIALLSHPNLVTLHDVGRCDAGPYLVLELLRGETLKQRLRRGPLAPEEALRIALAVASGLAHAHARGVVHRDLKPGNVFLCEDGAVKVLDFGLAHAFGQERLAGGTPDYMAPEQWRGEPEDARTDVFAVGVLLYRMIAGAPPFPDDQGATACSAAPAPALVAPELPGLAELVARLLSKDPGGRPRDGSALVEALRPLAPEFSGRGSSGFAPGAPPRPRRRVVLAALAAAAVLGGVTAALLVPPGGPAGPPSVAVLPFADLSPGRDQAYFSEGLAEEIQIALGRVEGLRVAGRVSSFAPGGRVEDVRAAGRRLGVGAVLAGSVRREGARIRVSAELVRVEDREVLWSQAFDREPTGIFAVQDEIAAAVVQALRVKLLARGAPIASRAVRTDHPEAYSLYLLARQHDRYDRLAESRAAAAAYEKALAIDPGYAPAWAGLAHALFWGYGNIGDSPEAIRAARVRAMAAAERAVDLAPDLADGYADRGFLRTGRFDWAGARADFERALVLDPGNGETHRLFARDVLAPTGRLDEALAHATRAAELDPLWAVTWTNLAAIQLGRGDLVAARAAAARSLELLPDQDFAPTYLAEVELLDRNPARALEVVRRCTEDLFRLQLEACALHDLGREREALAALAELEARFAEDGAYQVATVLAWRGERDAAFRWLERAVAQADPGLLDLELDPLLRPLRGDPRYRDLLRRVRLPAD